MNSLDAVQRLTRSEARGASSRTFFGPEYARIYDTLMAEIPCDSWVDYILDLAQWYAEPPKSVLDLACGTGTFALCAARRGLSVFAIDGSKSMLDVFRRKAGASPSGNLCTIRQARLPRFPRLGSCVDAAVWLFDSLNYLVEPVAVAETFCCVSRSLKPGGIFVFDVNTEQAYRSGAFEAPPEILLEGRALRVAASCQYHEAPKQFVLELECFDAETNVIQVRERHRQRFYGREPLCGWLEAAGFRLGACYRGFTLDPAKDSDDRWTFVAVKNAGPECMN